MTKLKLKHMRGTIEPTTLTYHQRTQEALSRVTEAATARHQAGERRLLRDLSTLQSALDMCKAREAELAKANAKVEELERDLKALAAILRVDDHFPAGAGSDKDFIAGYIRRNKL